jgi:hypothetical protein
MKTRAVIGLDLSLTGLGLCCVRTDWALRWGKVRFATAKTKPGEPLQLRMARLADYVLKWIRWSTRGVPYDVWAEAVPTARAYNIDTLGKLHGVVQHEIYRELGTITKEVSQSDARRLLAGSLPQRGKGDAIWSIVQQIAPGVFADDNQGDAFVVCNWGLSELGAPFVSVAAPAEPGKPKRARKAA